MRMGGLHKRLDRSTQHNPNLVLFWNNESEPRRKDRKKKNPPKTIGLLGQNNFKKEINTIEEI